jgi:hypothetical protein
MLAFKSSAGAPLEQIRVDAVRPARAAALKIGTDGAPVAERALRVPGVRIPP